MTRPALLLLSLLFLAGCGPLPVRVAARHADPGFPVQDRTGQAVMISGELLRLERGYRGEYSYLLRVLTDGREAFSGPIHPGTHAGTAAGSVRGLPASAVCTAEGIISVDVSCAVSIEGRPVGVLRF